VTRTHIPMHAVMRIDEVEKQGAAKIVPLSGKMEDIIPFSGRPSGGPAPKKGGRD